MSGQEADSTEANKNFAFLSLNSLDESIKLDHDKIRILPFRHLNNFGLNSPSAYYLKNNKMFYYGIESEGNNYVIDGMHLSNEFNFPIRSIGTFKQYTQNTPIYLGFALSGITEIKSKQVKRELDFTIDVNADFAHDMQSYNTEFSLGIPLASKKRRLSDKPLSTLYIGGKYTFTNNTDPVWQNYQKLDPQVLSELQTNPLRPSGTGFGTYPNAKFVTSDNFIDSKYPDNRKRNGLDLYSKIEIPIAKDIVVSIGNYSNISDSDVFEFDNAVFNATNNQNRTIKNINSYLNFKHQIQISEDISFSYDLHFQYTYYHSKTESKLHQNNFFEYGYLGLVDTYKTPTFELGSDTVNGVYYENVWLLNSWDYDTLVEWSPLNYNPGLAAYTNNFYSFYSNDPQGNIQNIDQIRLGGGLINGSTPGQVYGLWNNTGRQTDNYRENQNEKIRAGLKTELRIKSHTISLGGDYNKETQRSYSLDPRGLWFLMRNLTNYHIKELDYSNPVARDHNGHVDTIIYYRKYNSEVQRHFDINLRKALGLAVDGTDFILTDSYDMNNNTISYYDEYGKKRVIKTPENLLSLDLFSPAELLNSGYSYVNYTGFDYKGNKQSVNGNPYSFFTDYSIDAMQAVYGSAYIEDKFNWKGLNVRIGFRLDIYNSNRPELKDNYSLFPIYNVNEVLTDDLLEIENPENVDDDYLVYVDNSTYPNWVVGFRKDDTWFDALGNEVTTPEILGDGIGPYLKYPDLVQVGSESWSADMTFNDSETILNLLPQINIDYTIKERLNIFVNYNSSTQNPQYINDFRPDLYYYWHNITDKQVIPNPGLKPMRSGKLFAGLKGILYKNIVADAAFLMTTLDNYYYLDLVEYAYPSDYYTISNSKNRISTEGFLVSLNYINPDNSGFYGGINLTKLFPKEPDLNYSDISSLVMNTQLGYRFGDESNYKGPVWGNNKTLRGLSASLFYQFRKGTPYYYKNTHGAIGIKTTPNFNLVNLNIQKDFFIGSNAVINVYMTIENLLNTKNSFEVYPETGEPDDDGFLTDPVNQNYINSQLNPDSYRLLYQMHLSNPSRFDIPRIWRVGIIFRY